MEVFPETERLVLRQFTSNDVDEPFDLDGDPEVMRLLTGGRPTPRYVIQNKILSQFLHYYERFEGFGFWASIEKSTGSFWGGSSSGHRRAAAPMKSSSAGCLLYARERLAKNTGGGGLTATLAVFAVYVIRGHVGLSPAASAWALLPVEFLRSTE